MWPSPPVLLAIPTIIAGGATTYALSKGRGLTVGQRKEKRAILLIARYIEGILTTALFVSLLFASMNGFSESEQYFVNTFSLFCMLTTLVLWGSVRFADGKLARDLVSHDTVMPIVDEKRPVDLPHPKDGTPEHVRSVARARYASLQSDLANDYAGCVAAIGLEGYRVGHTRAEAIAKYRSDFGEQAELMTFRIER